jgi:hypothetical protein
MNINDVKKFISKQFWIFAKTYVNTAPHEYIVRGKADGTDEEFMGMVYYIQKYGQTMWFWSKVNKYIYLDGYYYWVMTDNMVQNGDEVALDYNDSTIIINRSIAKNYLVSIKWKGLQK